MSWHRSAQSMRATAAQYAQDASAFHIANARFWEAALLPIAVVVVVSFSSCMDEVIGQLLSLGIWYMANLYVMGYSLQVLHPQLQVTELAQLSPFGGVYCTVSWSMGIAILELVICRVMEAPRLAQAIGTTLYGLTGCFWLHAFIAPWHLVPAGLRPHKVFRYVAEERLMELPRWQTAFGPDLDPPVWHIETQHVHRATKRAQCRSSPNPPKWPRTEACSCAGHVGMATASYALLLTWSNVSLDNAAADSMRNSSLAELRELERNRRNRLRPVPQTLSMRTYEELHAFAPHHWGRSRPLATPSPREQPILGPNFSSDNASSVAYLELQLTSTSTPGDKGGEISGTNSSSNSSSHNGSKTLAAQFVSRTIGGPMYQGTNYSTVQVNSMGAPIHIPLEAERVMNDSTLGATWEGVKPTPLLRSTPNASIGSPSLQPTAAPASARAKAKHGRGGSGHSAVDRRRKAANLGSPKRSTTLHVVLKSSLGVAVNSTWPLLLSDSTDAVAWMPEVAYVASAAPRLLNTTDFVAEAWKVADTVGIDAATWTPSSSVPGRVVENVVEEQTDMENRLAASRRQAEVGLKELSRLDLESELPPHRIWTDLLAFTTLAMVVLWLFERGKAFEFSIPHLVLYNCVFMRVPDLLGNAVISSLSNPQAPQSAATAISMAYMVAMQTFLLLLRWVCKCMSTRHLFPRFYYLAQMYYYLFWYMMIMVVSPGGVENWSFWVMVGMLNGCSLVSNVGALEQLGVVISKRRLVPDQPLKILFDAKLAVQDQLADVVSLLVVPSIATSFHICTSLSVARYPGDVLFSLWLRFGVLLVARLMSGLLTEGIYRRRLELLFKADAMSLTLMPSDSAHNQNRLRYLNDICVGPKLAQEALKNIERCELYFAAVAVICTFAVFQRGDVASRYAFVAYGT